MKLNLLYLVHVFSVPLSHCWQYFKSMSELGKHNIAWEQVKMTSYDYTFGDCYASNLYFQTHVHLDRTELVDKLILRRWLEVKRIPTCVRIRQTEFETTLMYQPTEFELQICVAKVVYIHHRRRWIYYYFEVFKSVESFATADWDFYFYTTGEPDWTINETADEAKTNTAAKTP